MLSAYFFNDGRHVVVKCVELAPSTGRAPTIKRDKTVRATSKNVTLSVSRRVPRKGTL